MSLNGVKNWWSSASSSSLLMCAVVGLLVFSLMGSINNTSQAQRLIEHNRAQVNKAYGYALTTSNSRVEKNTEILEYGEFLDDKEDRTFLDIVIPDEYTDGL